MSSSRSNGKAPGRSKSFNTNPAKGNIPAGTSRAIAHRQSLHSATHTKEAQVAFLEMDITDVIADVIVCPVGPMLQMDKGISSVVMEKAGSGLKRWLTDKRKERPLPNAHAFVSGSFNLKYCAHIIHVVVPKMPINENPSTCIRDLEKAFSNCFQQLKNVKSRSPAGRREVETLAIPALGAGTNKIPKDLVAEVMCDAVRYFLDKGKTLAPQLRKIYLVSLDREMLSLLRKEWDSGGGPSRSRDDRATKSVDSDFGKSGKRTEPAGGATYVVNRHSNGKGSPSTPRSTWYDRDDVTGGRPFSLHSQDALVARGGSSNDRGGENYLQSSGIDKSKGRSHFRSTGSTSHDTDSDSDSKHGACGGAKSHRDYPLNHHMDRPQEHDSYFANSDYNYNGITGSKAVASSRYVTDSKKVAQIDLISPRSGQRRRSDSEDENCEATFNRTRSLTLKDSESCPICFDPIVGKNSESLPMCGHKVCKDCWKELKLQNPICPVCRKVYGELRGNQPEKARMTVKIDRRIHLPGYERSGTVVIDYVVPDGKQTAEHPNPGMPYKGTQRTAFLPNNSEGNVVLRLLEKAFRARLIFTIGRSVTTGMDDVATWNDIHHKTNISGPEFGYPDPTYLTRVKEELAAKGIQ